MKDVLEEIVAHKRIEVEEQKKRRPINEICRLLERKTVEARSLKSALENSDSGIIAEFKRRSPSKGWINACADVKPIAQSYEVNGATALSVLSDKRFFGGTAPDVETAASVTHLPVLRKEFIIDEYQIYETKLLGANAILLIAAAISKEECRRFTAIAKELRLEVLLELHDEKETDYISSHPLIGINNRNLGTFVTHAERSFQMTRILPKEALWVSESGISSPTTVRELREAGYRGFLIGENFMKTVNPGASLGAFVRELKKDF